MFRDTHTMLLWASGCACVSWCDEKPKCIHESRFYSCGNKLNVISYFKKTVMYAFQYCSVVNKSILMRYSLQEYSWFNCITSLGIQLSIFYYLHFNRIFQKCSLLKWVCIAQMLWVCHREILKEYDPLSFDHIWKRNKEMFKMLSVLLKCVDVYHWNVVSVSEWNV